MSGTGFNRREFHRLSAMALGGVIAGSLAGCEKPGSPPEVGGSAKPAVPPAGGSPTDTSESVSLLLEEPHVCRGLNTCKGLGRSKENACAGQGTCASVADHACGGQNECKGQGGCGANPGENSCKGQGTCHVPVEHVWAKARKNFEAAMQSAGKTFGEAPAKS